MNASNYSNTLKHKFSIRHGISLAELTTTIALVAVVVAILLPAIQSARAAARMAVCEDRLTEIAIESHDYEAIHCRLPCQLAAPGGAPSFNDWSNTSSPYWWGHQQCTSPLALAATTSTEFDIDPILFDFDRTMRGTNMRFYNIDGYTELAFEEKPRYRCPAFSRLFFATPSQGHLLVAQPLDFPGGDFIGSLVDANTDSVYGRTNFVGCLGASSGGGERDFDEYWHYRGMISSREEISLAHVTAGDGLSNSIMFGENIGGVVREGRQIRLQQSWGWLTGAVVRGRGLAPWMEDGTVAAPLLGNAFGSAVYGFGSFHRDGVNFAFGDGAVQMVARSVDRQVFYQMCGAFDTQ